jgi:hypothetical protein
MLHGWGLIKDSADVWFVNAIIVRPVALAWHPGAALAPPHVVGPGKMRVIFAYPA